ncbi:MAG TPA: hypothetical protein VJW51_06860 [Candidatus Acidoferrales bacterium]|nr:hypothetical protein [Candidatus Acidoferrales bacterium]
MDEILIFADDDQSVFACVSPDLKVRGFRQADFRDVAALRTSGNQEFTESQGELVIEENFHFACSTTWSA